MAAGKARMALPNIAIRKIEQIVGSGHQMGTVECAIILAIVDMIGTVSRKLKRPPTEAASLTKS